MVRVTCFVGKKENNNMHCRLPVEGIGEAVDGTTTPLNLPFRWFDLNHVKVL